MISSKNLNDLFYSLKTICSNNSSCEFCPLLRVCENSTYLYHIEYEDIDELCTLVKENE